MIGPDAEDDDPAAFRRGKRRGDGCGETGGVADDVIGGEDEKRGARFLRRDQDGGGGDGRGRIAGDRLEQERRGGAGFGQRLLDQIAVIDAGDDHRLGEAAAVGDAGERQGEGRFAIDQRQERLRGIGARRRPQPRAGTAAQNDRNDHEGFPSGLDRPRAT